MLACSRFWLGSGGRIWRGALRSRSPELRIFQGNPILDISKWDEKGRANRHIKSLVAAWCYEKRFFLHGPKAACCITVRPFHPMGNPFKSTNEHRRACLHHDGHLSELDRDSYVYHSISPQKGNLDDLRTRQLDFATHWDALLNLPRLPSKFDGVPVIIAELLHYYLKARRSCIRTLGTLSSISGS